MGLLGQALGPDDTRGFIRFSGGVAQYLKKLQKLLRLANVFHVSLHQPLKGLLQLLHIIVVD